MHEELVNEIFNVRSENKLIIPVGLDNVGKTTFLASLMKSITSNPVDYEILSNNDDSNSRDVLDDYLRALDNNTILESTNSLQTTLNLTDIHLKRDSIELKKLTFLDFHNTDFDFIRKKEPTNSIPEFRNMLDGIFQTASAKYFVLVVDYTNTDNHEEHDSFLCHFTSQLNKFGAKWCKNVRGMLFIINKWPIHLTDQAALIDFIKEHYSQTYDALKNYYYQQKKESNSDFLFQCFCHSVGEVDGLVIKEFYPHFADHIWNYLKEHVIVV